MSSSIQPNRQEYLSAFAWAQQICVLLTMHLSSNLSLHTHSAHEIRNNNYENYVYYGWSCCNSNLHSFEWVPEQEMHCDWNTYDTNGWETVILDFFSVCSSYGCLSTHWNKAQRSFSIKEEQVAMFFSYTCRNDWVLRFMFAFYFFVCY